MILAIAIAYFAYALLSFTQQVPGFIQALDRVTPHVNTIVEEVSLVREEVTQVRQVIDKELPNIISQVDSSLPLVEEGLSQSKYYSQQIPELFKHLSKVEEQVAEIQQVLPDVLNRIDSIVLMADKTTAELSQWRPHSTQYLAELEKSREDIPQYLTRIEYIVNDAKSIGKEASSGLVSGFFKGVISLPFEVVSGLTGIIDSNSKSAKLLTAADVTLLQERTIELLENNTQQNIFWQNSQTGNRGRILKGDEFEQKGLLCHELTFINNLKGQEETLKELMCEDKQGLWQVM